LDLMETKLDMQDVRALSIQVLIKFGADCLYGLEVMSHTSNPRWLLAAILNFVRNKNRHAGCEVCESTGPHRKIWHA
jgi:hypothetical protein